MTAMCSHYFPALIEEVQQREWLWNTKHKYYHSKSRTKKSWDEISKKIKVQVHVCKNKWKNLRDCYRREVKKHGTIDQYPGTWKYFETLNFLSVLHGDLVHDSSDHQSNSETETQVAVKFEPLDDNYSEEIDNTEYKVEATEKEDPLPEKRQKLTDEDDSDMMFLKSLAPYMRQLDPVRKLVVRNKIQGVLISEIGLNVGSQSYMM